MINQMGNFFFLQNISGDSTYYVVLTNSSGSYCKYYFIAKVIIAISGCYGIKVHPKKKKNAAKRLLLLAVLL